MLPNDAAGFAGLACSLLISTDCCDRTTGCLNSSTMAFYPNTHLKGQRYHTQCMIEEIQVLFPRSGALVWFYIYKQEISNLFKTFNMASSHLGYGTHTHTMLLCWVFATETSQMRTAVNGSHWNGLCHVCACGFFFLVSIASPGGATYCFAAQTRKGKHHCLQGRKKQCQTTIIVCLSCKKEK